MGEYKLAFVHDPKDHKPFKRKRFRRVELLENPSAMPFLTLTSEEAQLLRKGLCSYDMNFRWEGNLTDSVKNKDHKEVVVRIYRSGVPSPLIFEARYRPVGEDQVLTLHTFTYAKGAGFLERWFERKNPTEAEEELENYQDLVHGTFIPFIRYHVEQSGNIE